MTANKGYWKTVFSNPWMYVYTFCIWSYTLASYGPWGDTAYGAGSTGGALFGSLMQAVLIFMLFEWRVRVRLDKILHGDKPENWYIKQKEEFKRKWRSNE